MKSNPECRHKTMIVMNRLKISVLMFIAVFLGLSLPAVHAFADSEVQKGGNSTVTTSVPSLQKVTSIVFTCNTWGMLEPCST